VQLHKYYILKTKENQIKIINSIAYPVMKTSLENKGFKLVYVIEALNLDDALKIYEKETSFNEFELIQPLGI